MPDLPPPPEVHLPSLALQALIAHTGVREFVICAGARNSALLVLLASVPGLRLWHHFEERAAAHFALGRILAHEQPVAVVTTSGTAAAELLPALIEAHYQGLPLIALTADRPLPYRKSGAPQSIEQANLFGPYATPALDLTSLAEAPSCLAALASWSPRCPLHLNLCLEEPTAANLPALRQAGASLCLPSLPCFPRPTSSLPPAPPLPLLILGDLLPSERAAATHFALALQAPIYAEAASGLRESPALRPWLITGGDAALASVPHRSVIRLGGVPACRFWRDLENRPLIPVLSLSRSGHSGLARPSQVLPLHSLPPAPEADPIPSPLPTSAPDPWAQALDDCLARHPTSEPALVHHCSTLIPPGALVFTGNSLAIRQWNLAAARHRPHHARALRGANGIEGNLSAFLGLAADAPEAWALVGDLTALYDLAAPWVLPQMPLPSLRLVVLHNAGGKIFSRLPSLRDLSPFERELMENPHHVSLAGWASQWGLAHRIYHGPVPADALLPHRVVLELHPDPAASEAFWQDWATSCPPAPLP